MVREPGFEPTVTLAQSRKTLLEVEIHVVTPLFGGSAVAGQVDQERPVSAASVRGQLRFWWRACKGASFDTAEDLFRAEEAVWGSTKVPSALWIEVTTLSTGQLRNIRIPRQGNPSSLDWAPGYPGYALFPFQEKTARQGEPARPAATGQDGVRFQVSLSMASGIDLDRRSALERDVNAAVWAWTAFGGVGARTRRGCGSLWCSDKAFHLPAGMDPGKWLLEQAAKHVVPGPRKLKIPVLSGARLLLGGQPATAVRAWNDSVRPVQQIRQGPKIGRREVNPTTRRPGRSYWPEPDSLRDRLAIDPGHRAEHVARPAFPRADLGLPIIFQQMDQRSDPTLEADGKGATRFASPLIVKALALSPTSAVPIALLLEAPHVWEGPGVVLKHSGRPQVLPKEQLDTANRDGATPIPGTNRAREAVLAHYAKQGYREVKL